MKNLFQLTLPFAFLFFCCSGQSTHSSSQIQIKVGQAPGCVEVANLNKDKFPDLIVTNEKDSSVTILLGREKTLFEEAKGSPFPAGHAVNDVAIGDFNNDTHLDLAFANQ